jgi:hypothetical protein
MDSHMVSILVVGLYKSLCLLSGVLLSFWGYKLFMAGNWGNAGHAEGSFGDNKILIKKAAPGTFFVLMGAIVLAISVYKGMAVYEDGKGIEGHVAMSMK